MTTIESPTGLGGLEISAISSFPKNLEWTHNFSHFAKPVGVSLLTKAVFQPLEIQ